jgi:hypothetical protein
MGVRCKCSSGPELNCFPVIQWSEFTRAFPLDRRRHCSHIVAVEEEIAAGLAPLAPGVTIDYTLTETIPVFRKQVILFGSCLIFANYGNEQVSSARGCLDGVPL